MFSSLGDIMSTVEGYLEYRGGYSVLWGDSWCMTSRIEPTIGEEI